MTSSVSVRQLPRHDFVVVAYRMPVSSGVTVGIQNPDDRDEYEQLIILIMCNEHTDIMSIIKSDMFKAVVNDIRPE